MKKKAGIVLLHILSCLVFLALPILFAPGPGLNFDILTNPHTLRDFLGFVLMLGFFYLNYYLLIPRLYFGQKYVYFILSVLVCFFLVAYIPGLLVPNTMADNIGPPMGIKPPPSGFNFFEISHSIFQFLVVFFVSLYVKINARLKQTEREKVTTELSYLKAQINPHFLFNTLNSIYSLAIQKSDNTALAVVELSGMMRYVISEADKDFVPLQKEVDYVCSYIALQKIRLGKTVNVWFDVTGPTINQKIAPLILIPFIENAFKYGVNPEENSLIKIDIHIDANTLHLHVVNNKVTVRPVLKAEGGLGLSNTKSRLELLYQSKYELEIIDNPKDFLVSLRLELK